MQDPDKPKLKQPLETLHIDEALLRIQTVIALTGLSRTTIYARMAADPPTFPKSVQLGTRCTRWRAVDIKAFLKTAQA